MGVWRLCRAPVRLEETIDRCRIERLSFGAGKTNRVMKGSPMDIYRALGVEPIINAGGTLTRLSGSVMHPEVVDAMAAAISSFVTRGELQEIPSERQIDLKGLPMRMVIPRLPGA